MSAARQLAVVRTDPAEMEYHPTGLALPDGLTFAQWQEVGKTLQMMERSVNWWVGDWLNYGERRYGEKYTQALEGTDRRLQTLMNMASVAGRIEPARRRPALSWSCHRAVAYLEPADQDRILGDAERQGWGSREVEEAVASLKKSIPAPPAESEQSTRAGRLSGAEESTRSGEIVPPEEPAEPAQAEPEHQEYGAAPEVDVAAELTHALEENQRLQEQLDVLTTSSDLAAEVTRWSEKYARLEGRVRQLQTTASEAQRQATYYGELLKKIRQTLGVRQTQEILPKLREVVG